MPPRSRIITIVLLAIVPFVGYWLLLWGPREFYPKYRQLAIGMTESEAVELFSREPDGVCVFGNNRVLYFRRNAVGDDRPKQEPTQASNIKDVPSYFGCAQLLFDSQGKLSAFTINREEIQLTTREGKFPGYSIDSLDKTLLERLRLPKSEN